MKLAVIGASGHGKVVADLAEVLGFEVCFYDDAYPDKNKVEHWCINGTTLDIASLNPKTSSLVVAIGNNKIRRQIIGKFKLLGFNLPTLIHPSATVSQYASIGYGTVVFAGSVINAFAKLGCGVIINTNSTVEHDCLIEDYVHLSPNVALAGGTQIGECAWMGISSCTKQLTKVEKGSIIGANSVVLNNISKNVVAVGNPAKVIKEFKC